MKSYVVKKRYCLVLLLMLTVIVGFAIDSNREHQADEELALAREQLKAELLTAKQQLTKNIDGSEIQLASTARFKHSVEEAEALLVLSTLYGR